jgi:fructose-1-phosphate kinase PfkB-like protein
MGTPRVVVWGPSPLLAVTIGPGTAGDSVDVDAAGQAVWALRAAAGLGAPTALCTMLGGRLAEVVLDLLAVPDVEARVVPTGGCGCYVTDDRGRPPTSLAVAWAPAPAATSTQQLLDATVSAVHDGDVLVVCNPMPGEALPLDVYGELVSRVRQAGARVVVDLSSPRLESAVPARPDVVKINDWELAETVAGPVGEPGQRRRAVERLLERGAGSVVVTRASATVLAVNREGDRLEMTPPPQTGPGTPAGCGDTMTGALAAALAMGSTWRDAIRLGVAAGSAHFAVGGAPARADVEALAGRVSVVDAR